MKADETRLKLTLHSCTATQHERYIMCMPRKGSRKLRKSVQMPSVVFFQGRCPWIPRATSDCDSHVSHAFHAGRQTVGKQKGAAGGKTQLRLQNVLTKEISGSNLLPGSLSLLEHIAPIALKRSASTLSAEPADASSFWQVSTVSPGLGRLNRNDQSARNCYPGLK